MANSTQTAAHTAGPTVEDAGRIYFAGGSKGPNARADGNGGFLRRGYYFWTAVRELLGPFDSEAQAALVRSSLNSRTPLCEAELIGDEFAALRALRRKGIMASSGVYLTSEGRAAIAAAKAEPSNA